MSDKVKNKECRCPEARRYNWTGIRYSDCPNCGINITIPDCNYADRFPIYITLADMPSDMPLQFLLYMFRWKMVVL